MIKKLLALAALATAFNLTAPKDTAAQTAPAATQDNASLVMGLGYRDALRGQNPGAAIQIEIVSGNTMAGGLKFWAGAEFGADGPFYSAAGVSRDWTMANDKIIITPSFGAGLYSAGGSGKNLGSPVQFRSQIAVGTELSNGVRWQAALSHISNAGLGKKNPGTETVSVRASVPFGFFY